MRRGEGVDPLESSSGLVGVLARGRKKNTKSRVTGCFMRAIP